MIVFRVSSSVICRIGVTNSDFEKFQQPSIGAVLILESYTKTEPISNILRFLHKYFMVPSSLWPNSVIAQMPNNSIDFRYHFGSHTEMPKLLLC